MYNLYPRKEDAIIYIKTDFETAKERIKKRDRLEERISTLLDRDFLRRSIERTQQWLNQTNLPVLTLEGAGKLPSESTAEKVKHFLTSL